MKKSKTMSRYLYLFLIDAVFVFALLFIHFVCDYAKGGPPVSYADVFILFGIPLYLLLRAILTRVFLKNPWWPNLMLLVEISPGLPLLSGEFFEGDWKFVFGSLAIAAITAAISMVISLLTGLITRLIYLKKSN